LLAGFLERFHQLGIPRGERIDSRLKLVNIARAACRTLRRDGVVELLAQYRRLAPELLELGRILDGQVWLARATERFAL
jgi:hypothetical protein